LHCLSQREAARPREQPRSWTSPRTYLCNFCGFSKRLWLPLQDETHKLKAAQVRVLLPSTAHAGAERFRRWRRAPGNRTTGNCTTRMDDLSAAALLHKCVWPIGDEATSRTHTTLPFIKSCCYAPSKSTAANNEELRSFHGNAEPQKRHAA
jgi:hypothetical protein